MNDWPAGSTTTAVNLATVGLQNMQNFAHLDPGLSQPLWCNNTKCCHRSACKCRSWRYYWESRAETNFVCHTKSTRHFNTYISFILDRIFLFQAIFERKIYDRTTPVSVRKYLSFDLLSSEFIPNLDVSNGTSETEQNEEYIWFHYTCQQCQQFQADIW
jgi:hypothetical protein